MTEGKIGRSTYNTGVFNNLTSLICLPNYFDYIICNHMFTTKYENPSRKSCDIICCNER